MLQQNGVDVSKNIIDAQNKSVVANPGEISRGPFVQPLYAGLDITDYVLIDNIKIEQIVQQIKVDVEESGTEAASVTAFAGATGCCPLEKPKPIVMTVNRPFIFEIAEDTSNTILFTGVVNNVE